MNGSQLRAWRKHMGLNQRQAADIHGYGHRAYKMMEQHKDEQVRDCIALACAAYAMGIRNYDGPDIQTEQKRKRK